MSEQAVAAAPGTRLTQEELRLIDAYWRAANYLSVGQIYLLDNPLLRHRLEPEHVKPRLLGHWGTTPGLNFIYAHMNRVIRNGDLNAIFLVGPGHGGPAAVANAYLEGTYSEVYPEISRDEEGMRRLFRQFSFPGGIPSHVAPETPGSIHEGGELGYALSHAYGAAFDNPDLLVCCVVGDGEAETGPLATGWHSNKFLNAATDGAVLPILHLNGYKIANPTILARIGDDELNSLLEGYGHAVHWVDGDEPEAMHQRMAEVLDTVVEEIAAIQRSGAPGGQDRAPALADDRDAHAEGLDGPQGGRREADGGHVALAPGAARRDPDEPRPPRAARGLAEELPGRGALRRRRRPHPGPRGAAPEELPAHEREPERERRPAAPAACAARLPRLRGHRRGARQDLLRGDPRARRRSCATSIRPNPDRFRIFGPDETASNRLERGLRGDRARLGGRDPAHRRGRWPPRAA